LEDVIDDGNGAGTQSAPIHTNVDSLSVTTSAGVIGGSQFFREANGLNSLLMQAGNGAIALTLTNGSLTDSDSDVDISGTSARIILDDANDTGVGVGTGTRFIQTAVAELTVSTNSGTQHGDQYLWELDGLSAIELNAGAATISLTLKDGSLEDGDAADDVIASSAIIVLEDAIDDGNGAGTQSAPIHTNVDSLSVTTFEFVADAGR
jgi:uncharacterized membrane protein